MNKIIKIALILIGSGLILCLLAVFLVGGVWTRFNSKGNDLLPQSYESGTNISAIEIEESARDIKLQSADIDTIRIDYYDDPENPVYTVSEDNGKLSFRHTGNGAFKLVNIDLSDRTTVITVPKDYEGDLDVKLTAGSVTAEDISAGQLEIENTAGSIELNNVNCHSNIDIANTSGSVEFKNLASGGDINIANTTGSVGGSIAGAESDYSISTSVTAGSSNLTDSTGGAHKLNASTTAGSIEITFTK